MTTVSSACCMIDQYYRARHASDDTNEGGSVRCVTRDSALRHARIDAMQNNRRDQGSLHAKLLALFRLPLPR